MLPAQSLSVPWPRNVGLRKAARLLVCFAVALVPELPVRLSNLPQVTLQAQATNLPSDGLVWGLWEIPQKDTGGFGVLPWVSSLMPQVCWVVIASH